MSLLDWASLAAAATLVVALRLFVSRQITGVVDFLAAGRGAGRYLVANAEGMAAVGAATTIAVFQQMYFGGPAVGWWLTLGAPVGLFLALTGFVIYRFRETRALTMAQFFEMRYGRRFRIFMGLLSCAAGLLNFGLIPVIGARFLVHFCGLPARVSFGGFTLPCEVPVMAATLGFALWVAFRGGQLALVVTDCVEGMLGGVLFLLVAFAVLAAVGLEPMREALVARPPGESFLDPFDTLKLQDFNLAFVGIALFFMVYQTMAWQGNQGFNASALDPHEARMGRIIGQWRGYARGVMLAVAAYGAYAVMHHGSFAGEAAAVNGVLAGVEGGEAVARQLVVPVALGQVLPAGIKGALVAVMVFAILAADSSQLHSWGSILVQDVILPLRGGRPLEPGRQLRWLRLGMAGVAAFAFGFGLLLRQTEYVFMYFALVGAVYLGGAGSVIIGGLYWRRGTARAAWGAMGVGALVAATGMACRQVDPAGGWNGQVWAFAAALGAIGVYVGLSLAGRERFDLEGMLGRARGGGAAAPGEGGMKARLERLLGIDARFSRGDRLQSWLLFGYSMFWFALFLAVTGWNLVHRWPIAWWWYYFLLTNLLMPLVLGVVTTVWFTWGGWRDLRRFFRHLREVRRPPEDGQSVNR